MSNKPDKIEEVVKSILNKGIKIYSYIDRRGNSNNMDYISKEIIDLIKSERERVLKEVEETNGRIKQIIGEVFKNNGNFDYVLGIRAVQQIFNKNISELRRKNG